MVSKIGASHQRPELMQTIGELPDHHPGSASFVHIGPGIAASVPVIHLVPGSGGCPCLLSNCCDALSASRDALSSC